MVCLMRGVAGDGSEFLPSRAPSWEVDVFVVSSTMSADSRNKTCSSSLILLRVPGLYVEGRERRLFFLSSLLGSAVNNRLKYSSRILYFDIACQSIS
jgi:hypothetical protein